jgi:hypothetical protein
VSILRLLAISTALFWAFTTFSVLRHIGTPFAGFFHESTLVVSTIRPPGWSGTKAGLIAYEVLLSANGTALRSSADLDRIVRSVPIGTPIVYETLRDGKRLRLEIPTQSFGWPEYFASFFSLQLSGATFLLIGAVAFWLKPTHPAAQAHLLLSLTFSLFNTSMYCWLMSHRFVYAQTIVVNLIGSTLIHLALTFPTSVRAVKNRRWLEGLPYLPTFLSLPAFMIGYRPLGYAVAPEVHAFYQHYLLAFSAWSVFGIIWLLCRLIPAAVKGDSPLASNQAKLVLFGACASFVPQIFIYMVPIFVGQGNAISSAMVILGNMGFHFFPFSVAYAIVRHQLFDIQLVIRRATLYLGLTALLAALYILAAGIAYDLLGRLTPLAPGPSLPGFLAALSVAVAFRPLHDRLRRTLDRIFLGERADALRLLADFTPEGGLETEALASRILDLVQAALAPRWIRLELAGGHVAARGEPPGASDAHLAVALSDGARLVIGPRSNELPYGPEERGLIEVLAAQSALALQGARLFEERLRSLIQEGVAVRLAEERAAMGLQVIRELQDDLLAIAHATDEAERNPLDATALNAIPERLDRIEEALSEKTRWIKGQGEAP